MDKAIEYAELLKRDDPELFAILDGKLDLTELTPKLKYASAHIYLNQPNEQNVLPQDATYLTLPDIDLSKYKQQSHVGGIYKDYNQEQICKLQVTKQADVLVLFEDHR